MGEVLPLPNRGEVFLDPRGEGRTLRVSWHRDEDTLVLSMWQLGQCRATFRLTTDEVPDLVRALVAGLSDGLAQHRDTQLRSGHDQAPRQLHHPINPKLGGSEEPTQVVAHDAAAVPDDSTTAVVDAAPEKPAGAEKAAGATATPKPAVRPSGAKKGTKRKPKQAATTPGGTQAAKPADPTAGGAPGETLTTGEHTVVPPAIFLPPPASS